jgi:hypothetical protein
MNNRRRISPIATEWGPLAATIRREHLRMQLQKGDAMAKDSDSFFEFQFDAQLQRLRNAIKARADHQQMVPRIKMIIGSWYIDEFGNQTRQIRARDEQRPRANEKAPAMNRGRSDAHGIDCAKH